MHQRDFIIGSLHGLGPNAVIEMTPRVDTLHPSTLDRLEMAASELAAGKVVAGVSVFDVERMYQRLRDRTVAQDVTPSTSGLLIDRVLAALPRGPAADIAIRLVGSMRDQQLARVGRAGILAMRDAACLAPPEEGEAAVQTLDGELERRGPLRAREVGGTWIIAEGAASEALDAANDRLDRMHAQPRLANALDGLIVMVVPAAERDTERSMLLAHARAFAAREFDPRLNATLASLHDNNVTMLDEGRLMEQALRLRPFARRAKVARSVWRGLAARLRMGPEPLIAEQ